MRQVMIANAYGRQNEGEASCAQVQRVAFENGGLFVAAVNVCCLRVVQETTAFKRTLWRIARRRLPTNSRKRPTIARISSGITPANLLQRLRRLCVRV
jgi:hypothetical protein